MYIHYKELACLHFDWKTQYFKEIYTYITISFTITAQKEICCYISYRDLFFLNQCNWFFTLWDWYPKDNIVTVTINRPANPKKKVIIHSIAGRERDFCRIASCFYVDSFLPAHLHPPLLWLFLQWTPYQHPEKKKSIH